MFFSFSLSVLLSAGNDFIRRMKVFWLPGMLILKGVGLNLQNLPVMIQIPGFPILCNPDHKGRNVRWGWHGIGKDLQIFLGH